MEETNRSKAEMQQAIIIRDLLYNNKIDRKTANERLAKYWLMI